MQQQVQFSSENNEVLTDAYGYVLLSLNQDFIYSDIPFKGGVEVEEQKSDSIQERKKV